MLYQPLSYAEIVWKDGFPYAPRFQDIYFSHAGGLEEKKYVFIEGNHLKKRFSCLQERQTFAIGETGFGTALNFLLAWQCFEMYAPKLSTLHYIGFEKYPVSAHDMRKIIGLWPSLMPFLESFLKHAPRTIVPGFHTVSLYQGRIRLTLILGDILEQIQEVCAQVDAWFLDGFSPRRNTSMWTQDLLKKVYDLSVHDATYATYTAASAVKQGLKEAGFSVSLNTGFGTKRHMLFGHCLGKEQRRTYQNPIWLHVPETKRWPISRSAVVIGAGLAGCSTAYALSKRGWKVMLLEQHARPFAGASGNRQGALHLRLSAAKTVLSDLLLSGYSYTTQLLYTLIPNQRARTWNDLGLLQMVYSQEEYKRQADILKCFSKDFVEPLTVQNQSVNFVSGVKGIIFVRGGWVHPAALCRALISASNITLHCCKRVMGLQPSRSTGWNVQCEDGSTLQSEVVVVAQNHEADQYLQTAHLPLKKIRGQVTYIPTAGSSPLMTKVLCRKSYILPAFEGMHTVGATYQFHDEDKTVRHADHQYNVQRLACDFPWMFEQLGGEHLYKACFSGNTGFRCGTPDYLPIVGPVVDAGLFNRDYAHLAKDAKFLFKQTPPYYKGLYVNTGHGSRGLISAPISGECIASYIEGQSFPLSEPVRVALHPSRFLARSLIRGKKHG